MKLSFDALMDQIVHQPVLAIVLILAAIVIFVNGWTDAPNAITACVSTGVMDVGKAIRMAAVFNFAGLFFMSLLHAKVAYTIYHMVDFGEDTTAALTALCAALFAIILWAVCAWWFGIPTSESHALMAGLTGAAMAISGGIVGVNFQEWKRILWGLILSVLFGYVLGWILASLLRFLQPKGAGEEKCSGRQGMMDKAQTAGAAAMAFMHGAQDGQKFLGVLLLGIALTEGKKVSGALSYPFWMIVLCSLLMAVGTCVGGKRIIKKVGCQMVLLQKDQGFAADLAGVICLLWATISGLPVSTTHVKTTAMIGAASVGEHQTVNRCIVRQMVTAWIFTFPMCGLIGYITAKIFLKLF